MPDASQRARVAAGAALLLVVFCSLAIRTWGRWPDPQLDFGNELYIAWQLSEGRSLYGDIAHRNGPFSHYWNALLFRAFGASFYTLVWANLAVLAACTGLAFAVLRRFAGTLGAWLGALALLTIFAFGQYVDVGNYNFVTPYHHFQTHGVALGLLLLWSLLRVLEGGGRAWAALAGACCGALLLTKLELWLPGLLAAGAGVVLWWRAGVPGIRSRLAAFAGGAAAVIATFFAVLARDLPTHDAWLGLLGNLAHVGPALADDAFYRAGAGLDAPRRSLLRIGMAGAALAGCAGVIVAADRLLRRGTAAATTGLAALLAVGLVALVAPRTWFAVAGLLPLVALAGVLAAAPAAWRDRRGDALATEAAALLLWSLWSLGLLAKLALAPRFHHYGFSLALPATLLLVAGAVQGLPRAALRAGGSGRFARAAAVALSLVVMVGCLRVADARHRARTLWIGPDAESIRVDAPSHAPRGARIEALRRRLEELLPPDATLVAYPEGAQLNYWLRRRNPSRYVLFLPTELDAFGRDAVLADLRRAAPDYVVLVHRGHAEFGVGPFGAGPRNGRDIVTWVRTDYEPVERIGAAPFSGLGFGAEIWRRKGARPAS